MFFFFFFGLQDSCPFPSSKRAFGTPDEREVRRNNGLVYVLTSDKQTKQLIKQQTKRLQESACQAKQAANKAVVHQPRAEPVRFFFFFSCSFSPKKEPSMLKSTQPAVESGGSMLKERTVQR